MVSALIMFFTSEMKCRVDLDQLFLEASYSGSTFFFITGYNCIPVLVYVFRFSASSYGYHGLVYSYVM